MDRRKLWRNVTRIHKWAGLVLGAQIILWFASGLFMSFFHIDKVHGDHIAEERTWPLRMEQMAPFDDVQNAYFAYQTQTDCDVDTDIQSCFHVALREIKLHSALGTPVWEFNNGETQAYFSGNPVTIWQGLSKDKIREAAHAYYKGDAKINKAVLFTDIVPKDFRKDIPIWQISFDDKSHTRLYIDPIDGALINVRTRLWRTFDFMWMLHIMDYKERDNINLWWLKLAAFAALMFALSGAALVTHRVFMRPKKIRVKKIRPPKT